MKAEFNSIIKQSLYSAKISSMLAEENIAVNFSDTAHTASFDPMTRTITFPYTTDFMDQDVHEMFIFHEVSHALHLPFTVFSTLKEKGVDSDYFNVIIDIRDERLMKEKFPGAIPVFMRAYEKLLNRKFFGPKDDIQFKRFPDRLNVYAKLGIKNGSFIPMSKKELDFYDRCMKASTLEECIDLALELQKRKNDLVKDDADLLEYVRQSMQGALEDEDETDEEERQQSINDMMDQVRDARAQALFEESFKAGILNNAHVVHFKTAKADYCQMSPAKAYTDFLKTNYAYDNANMEVARVRDMRKDIRTTVDSMVRVFESKKAAARAKMARISETGSVDVNKLFRYKFDDKIFRKSTKMPNSKNHAYFIMVDFSGSMSREMTAVFEQIMVITEFFRRIQVPYKVVGFGASVHAGVWQPKQTTPEPSPIFNIGYQTDWGYVSPRFLFEILNSEQTLADHNLALSGIKQFRGFSLGDTPTNHAMAAAEQIASKFFDRVKADKKHIVCITDGDPTDKTKDGWSLQGKTILVVDPESKQTVITKSSAAYSMINAYGKVLEHRHNIRFTTLSLVNMLAERYTASFIAEEIQDVHKTQFRAKGFAKMVDHYTQNEIFFAKPLTIDTGIDDFDISDRKTTSQIARTLISNMKHVNKSKNFLNALAESLS